MAELRVVFADVTLAKRLMVAIGAAAVSVLELLGLALVVPLLSVLAGGQPPDVLGLADRGEVFSIRILLIAVATTFVVRGLLTLAYRWWVLGLVFDRERATVDTLMSAFLSSSFEEQLRRGPSDVLRTLRVSVGQAHQQVGLGLVNLLSELPALAAIGLLIVLIEPLAAGVLIVFLVIAGWGYQRLVSERVQEAGARFETDSAQDFRLLLQATQGTRELIVRQVERSFLRRISDNREAMAEDQRRVTFFGETPRIFLELVFVIGIGVVLLIVLWQRGGDEVIQSLGLFAVGGFRALPSTARILSALTGMSGARASLSRVASEMEQSRDRASRLNNRAPMSGSFALGHGDSIRFECVSFTYQTRPEPALRNVTFEIPARRSTALVGPSGAGKSTLLDVLLGLLEPSVGRVCAGTQEIGPNHVRRWQRELGVVPQQIHVINDTVAGNVRFGLDELSDGDVIEALKRAHLWQDIERLSAGIETLLGDGGARLSGGQTQRLGFARALCSRPSVLVLDEATSALDTVTEAEITNTIRSLNGELTTIVVAHRLSTVQHCDQIVYLEGGEVLDQGTYADLLARCNGFRTMVAAARVHGGPFEPLAPSDAAAQIDS